MPAVMPFFIVTGLGAGLLLGGLYFGGLWLSVMRIKKIKNKKMFLFVSWLLRSVFLCAGLFLMARHNVQMLLSAVAGVFLAKFLIVRTVKQKMAKEVL